jgi:starch-binding outer membrane protein, SusD/RagB family
MIPNKITKYLSLGLVTFFTLTLLVSCESEVVDLKPVNSLTDITAFSTPERVELAVIGAYDAAQCGKYNDSYSRGYPFGAASIIQGEMRGEDMNLTAAFYDLTYSGTYNTTTANNRFMWENSFEAINRYNTVLKGVDDAVTNKVISEETAKGYKGEVLFLRALTYHNLMIHFALPYNVTGNNSYGLPLYLTAINTPAEIKAALLIGRSTVQDTYKQILKDLDDAEANLPAVNTVNSITRAGKAAPIALKTRVYLHERNWAKVIEEAKKLTSNAVAAPFKSSVGSYELESQPETPFVSFSSNKESIFSIQNSTDDNADVNGAMSAMMSARTGGRAIITSSPILYNSKFWRSDDKRRGLLLYRASDKYYFCDKYQDPTTRKEYAPIIRYAEVLLNYAEAAIRSNDGTLALELLNSVRNRSLVDPVTQAYKAADFATSKDLLEAILWERRIEFHGEGRRWEDIHRLAADDLFPSGGIPAKIAYSNAKNKGVFVINGAISASWYSASAKMIPYTDKRFIWPIPFNDIIRNPTLAEQQNSGW